MTFEISDEEIEQFMKNTLDKIVDEVVEEIDKRLLG